MLRCKNCGGNLIFRIKNQDVQCVFCKSVFDPDSFVNEGISEAGNDPAKAVSSKDDGYFETYVMTCKQCGAMLVTPDNSAVSFCSYCGTESVLESRVVREKKPARIIPFKKTREECVDIYRELAKKEPYIPKEFEDPGYVERFRGIYIPFWEYEIGFSNDPELSVTETYSDTDYDYTSNYTVTPALSRKTVNIPYDASAGLDDEIAASIGPFFWETSKFFSEAYLAGFFADTYDVPPEVYGRDAITQAQEHVIKEIENGFDHNASVSIPSDAAKRQGILGTTVRNVSMGLYPVWFLTWRKDRRLAYAVINGETGAAYAEFPVDIRKFLLRSLLIAGILFLVFSIIGMLILPMTAVLIASFTALIIQLISLMEIAELRDKELNIENLGAVQGKAAEKVQKIRLARLRQGPKILGLGCVGWFFLLIFIGLAFLIIEGGETGERAFLGTFLILIAGFVTWIRTLKPVFSIREKLMFITVSLPFAAEILAFWICNEAPPQDWKYYAVCIIGLCAVLLNSLSLIINYNLLCTRGIPDFHDRKGGARYEAK